MIHKTNIVEQFIPIDDLIKWLQKEKAGGAENVTLRASHLKDPDNTELEEIGDYVENLEGENGLILTLKIEAL